MELSQGIMAACMMCSLVTIPVVFGIFVRSIFSDEN